MKPHLKLPLHGAVEVEVDVGVHVFPAVRLRDEDVLTAGDERLHAHLPDARHARCEGLAEDLLHAAWPCKEQSVAVETSKPGRLQGAREMQSPLLAMTRTEDWYSEAASSNCSHLLLNALPSGVEE